MLIPARCTIKFSIHYGVYQTLLIIRRTRNSQAIPLGWGFSFCTEDFQKEPSRTIHTELFLYTPSELHPSPPHGGTRQGLCPRTITAPPPRHIHTQDTCHFKGLFQRTHASSTTRRVVLVLNPKKCFSNKEVLFLGKQFLSLVLTPSLLHNFIKLVIITNANSQPPIFP